MRKQNFVRGGVVVLLTVLISSFLAPLASAATAASDAATNPNGAFDIVVSPPSIGIEVKPGETVSTDIRFQNRGLATEKVKVSLMKFGAQGQDGTPQLLDAKPEDTFVNWAKFSMTKFEAETNVWKTVKVTFTPPKTAAYGYYYAVVFSRDGAENQIKPQQANLLGAVASLVLLDVKAPGAVREAKITEFSTPNNVQEFLPVKFDVRLRNTGNTHVASRGNIVISKGGKNVALLEVNLKKGYILPDSYRKFSNEWADGTPVYKDKIVDGKSLTNKDGSHQKSLVWDKFSMSKLRFGKYTAKLVMVYDDGKSDVATTASLNFWVIPWRIIGGIVFVGLFVLAGLWGTVLRPLVRRFRKK